MEAETHANTLSLENPENPEIEDVRLVEETNMNAEDNAKNVTMQSRIMDSLKKKWSYLHTRFMNLVACSTTTDKKIYDIKDHPVATEEELVEPQVPVEEPAEVGEEPQVPVEEPAAPAPEEPAAPAPEEPAPEEPAAPGPEEPPVPAPAPEEPAAPVEEPPAPAPAEVVEEPQVPVAHVVDGTSVAPLAHVVVEEPVEPVVPVEPVTVEERA